MATKGKITAAVVLGGLALTACAAPETSASPGEPAMATPSESPATESPATESPRPERPSPRPADPPPFTARVSKVTRATVPHSWRPGCPVPLGDLRLVTLTHWGFDDRPHTGELIVHKDVTDDIRQIFKRLYNQRFPIKRMERVDVYKGDDFDSIEANNTSAFNCRPATGSTGWSKHAYGLALDLNPQQNPYVTADGSVAHKNARRYAGRPLKARGVINPGDRVVRTFEKFGWQWGGYWSGTKDYQHFSKGGG